MPTEEAYPREPMVLPQPRNEGPITDPPPVVQVHKALATKTDDRSFTDKMDNSQVTQRTTTPSTGGDKCFYAAEKLMKARQLNGKMEYLVKWVGDYAPSWQPPENISPFLMREYLITHTKQGKRRKRKYRYFQPAN